MKWFEHQSKMRHDVKLKRVISRYGLEGYGLYNLIIESIVENLETESPMPILEDSISDIAEFYNGNSEKIEEMVNFMVNQGLFDLTLDNDLACIKIYKYIQASQTRSDKIREMIKMFNNSGKNLVKSPNLRQVSETVRDNSEHYNTIHNNTKQDNTIQEKKNPPFGGFKKASRNYSNEYKPLQIFWNSLNLPESRKIAENIPNWDDLISGMCNYSLDEIHKAIENYSKIKDRDKAITYSTFTNFLIRGIEKYADSSYPFDNFKESEDEKNKRITAEAWNAEQAKLEVSE